MIIRSITITLLTYAQFFVTQNFAFAMPSQYRINKIVEIGDTLHRSGCAPYKVEKYTQHYAQKHGVDVMIQATPTAINYQFPDDNNAVVLKRLKPASINLSLLANTIIRINQPSSEPVPEPAGYPSWIIALANMGIPPAYLMLVGSTLEAVGFAFILGFMVWGCQRVCRARRAIAVEFIAALFTGIIVAYLSSTGLPIPVWALCIATIVLFVPGLSIANSLECLAFNDLVSGTSLLGQCALTLIKLLLVSRWVSTLAKRFGGKLSLLLTPMKSRFGCTLAACSSFQSALG